MLKKSKTKIFLLLFFLLSVTFLVPFIFIEKKSESNLSSFNSNSSSETIGYNYEIQEFSSNYNHSLALINDNNEQKLFTWGDNSSGQLGIGHHEIDKIPFPWQMNLSSFDNEEISKIYTSKKNSALLTSSGSVYLWGSNSNGQIGNGVSSTSSKNVYIPHKVDDSFFEGNKIGDLLLGDEFVIAVTENFKDEGILYGWGDNSHSQLTSKYNSETEIDFNSTPRKIDLKEILEDDFNRNRDDEIVFENIDSGSRHIIFSINSEDSRSEIDNNNNNNNDDDDDDEIEYYSWGGNDLGQTGLDSGASKINLPRKIDIDVDKNNYNLVTNHNSSFLFNDKNFYSWGDNQNGQIGQKEEEIYRKPISIKKLKNKKIDNVYSGLNHTFYHSKSEKKLYGSGLDENNILLNGEAISKILEPIEINDDRNPSIDIDSIEMIVTGNGYNFFVLNENGVKSIKSWGSNLLGQLGNLTLDDSSKPVQFNIQSIILPTFETINVELDEASSRALISYKLNKSNVSDFISIKDAEYSLDNFQTSTEINDFNQDGGSFTIPLDINKDTYSFKIKQDLFIGDFNFYDVISDSRSFSTSYKLSDFNVEVQEVNDKNAKLSYSVVNPQDASIDKIEYSLDNKVTWNDANFKPSDLGNGQIELNDLLPNTNYSVDFRMSYSNSEISSRISKDDIKFKTNNLGEVKLSDLALESVNDNFQAKFTFDLSNPSNLSIEGAYAKLDGLSNIYNVTFENNKGSVLTDSLEPNKKYTGKIEINFKDNATLEEFKLIEEISEFETQEYQKPILENIDVVNYTNSSNVSFDISNPNEFDIEAYYYFTDDTSNKIKIDDVDKTSGEFTIDNLSENESKSVEVELHYSGYGVNGIETSDLINIKTLNVPKISSITFENNEKYDTKLKVEILNPNNITLKNLIVSDEISGMEVVYDFGSSLNQIDLESKNMVPGTECKLSFKIVYEINSQEFTSSDSKEFTFTSPPATIPSEVSKEILTEHDRAKLIINISNVDNLNLNKLVVKSNNTIITDLENELVSNNMISFDIINLSPNTNYTYNVSYDYSGFGLSGTVSNDYEFKTDSISFTTPQVDKIDFAIDDAKNVEIDYSLINSSNLTFNKIEYETEKMSSAEEIDNPNLADTFEIARENFTINKDNVVNFKFYFENPNGGDLIVEDKLDIFVSPKSTPSLDQINSTYDVSSNSVSVDFSLVNVDSIKIEKVEYKSKESQNWIEVNSSDYTDNEGSFKIEGLTINDKLDYQIKIQFETIYLDPSSNFFISDFTTNLEAPKFTSVDVKDLGDETRVNFQLENPYNIPLNKVEYQLNNSGNWIQVDNSNFNNLGGSFVVLNSNLENDTKAQIRISFENQNINSGQETSIIEETNIYYRPPSFSFSNNKAILILVSVLGGFLLILLIALIYLLIKKRNKEKKIIEERNYLEESK